MLILRYVLLYGIILLGSLFIADRLKKKIEIGIAIELMATTLILYVFGILECLSIGLWVAIIGNVGLGLFTIIQYGKRHELKKIKNKIITPRISLFQYFICHLYDNNTQYRFDSLGSLYIS